ncbi:MAG: hypothetical protein IPN34_15145 [Planctomycetes bacterium]|nr:hypothetical protein [Planctomycetota bacterium]
MSANAAPPNLLVRRPLLTAVATWLLSLLAITAAIVLPMFGTHALLILGLGAWFATFGLPTAIAFGLTLYFWRGGLALPGLASDLSCALVAASAALVLHLVAYRLSARLACS